MMKFSMNSYKMAKCVLFKAVMAEAYSKDPQSDTTMEDECNKVFMKILMMNDTELDPGYNAIHFTKPERIVVYASDVEAVQQLFKRHNIQSTKITYTRNDIKNVILADDGNRVKGQLGGFQIKTDDKEEVFTRYNIY